MSSPSATWAVSGIAGYAANAFNDEDGIGSEKASCHDAC